MVAEMRSLQHPAELSVPVPTTRQQHAIHVPSSPSHSPLPFFDCFVTFRERSRRIEKVERDDSFRPEKLCVASMRSLPATEGYPVSPECINKGTERAEYCIESFYFITLNMLRSVGGVSTGRDADPLFSLLQAMEMLSRTDFSDGRGTKQCGLRMCHMCKIEFASEGVKAREEIWSLMPRWFGLMKESEVSESS